MAKERPEEKAARRSLARYYGVTLGPIKRITSQSRTIGFLPLFLISYKCVSCDFQGCKKTDSIEGYRLNGHVISTQSKPNILSCFQTCKLRISPECHSINYMLETFQCDMNNRTKKGKLQEFVSSAGYVYLENPFRAPLGVVRKLPGLSCKDIKDSYEDAASGEYWIDPDISNDPFTVFCDMKTDGGGWTLIAQSVVRNSMFPTSMSQTKDFKMIQSYTSGIVRVDVSALRQLKRLIKFTQLRYFCFKNSTGRIFHIMTKSNIAGQTVVKYLIEDSGTQPQACGSFETLPDDNSILASNCKMWGNDGSSIECDKWGYYRNRNSYRVYNDPIIWEGKYYVNLNPSVLACDDLGDLPLSEGDKWQLFVR